MCKLKPLTQDITIQEEEIEACKWMPFEEFFALPYYKGVYQVINEIEKKSVQGTYEGFKLQKLPLVWTKGINYLYSNL